MSPGSTEVVETVARKEEVDPAELTPELYEFVDPDALDKLLETGSVRVTFTYAGYRVTVGRDGDVRASARDAPRNPTS